MPIQKSGTTYKLAENLAAAGPWVDWQGGFGTITVEGSFAGTVTLQMMSQNGTAIAVGSNTTFTANGVAGFLLPPCSIRVNIATATAVYAYVIQN